MFSAYPAEWILIALAAFAVLAIPTILLVIPLVGPMLPPILLLLLLGGALSLADAQHRGLRPRMQLLFWGFRRHPGNLTLVGLFYALPLILIHLLVLLVGGGLLVALLGSSLGGMLAELADSIINVLKDLSIPLLVFFMLWGVLLMALLFAPALIMFANIPPLEAMRLSLVASLRSLGAIVVFAIVVYITFPLVVIPTAGLGILLFIPLFVGTLYAAYRDLFLQPEIRQEQD